MHETERCDPSLVWYLIEELLDSQNIEGCRRVFDYLESRRERLVTVSEPFPRVEMSIN